MSVTEAQRHQLFEAAKAVFGEANAETFMNLQPAVNPTDKNYLPALRSDLRDAMAELTADVRRELRRTLWISHATFAALLSALFIIVTLSG